MDKTKLAKWLVVANAALSLVFLAWAIGLYTNHVHWATPPADGGQRVQGMVEELRGEITRLVAARDAADRRFYDARESVAALEGERPARQKYYTDVLRAARQGDVTDINPPVQQLAFTQSGAVEYTKRSGRTAVQFDGQNALSVAGYNAALVEKAGQIASTQKQVTDLIGETDKLAKQVTGFNPPGEGERVTVEQKGLRFVLAEQEKLAQDLRLEQEFLRSPLTNFTIETELLRKRQAALRARLTELGTAATALGLKN